MSTARSLRLPVLWTAYLLVPVAGWGLFPGRPLGVLGAAALALVWWLFATGARLPGVAVAVACIVTKVLLGGLLSADRGFVAYYYANSNWTPPHERSVDYLTLAGTRVDGQLGFRDGGPREIPLFFFNDTMRFNFYEPAQPRRDRLPFSVTWTGHLHLQAPEHLVMYLAGPGVAGSLSVDGVELATIRPAEPWNTATVELPAGWRRLEVRLSVPYGGPRRFEAGVVEPQTGKRLPFGTETIRPRPLPAWRRGADVGVRGLALGADILLAVVLGSSTMLKIGGAIRDLRRPLADRRDRGRPALALGWLAGLLDAFLFAAPRAGRAVVLTGGDDWLTYESFARDIALHGPMMTLGAVLGQGQPFYYQPLYPYFLALVHLVFGEDLFGALLVQRFLLPVTAWAVWRLTVLLFGSVAGVVALLLGIAVLYGYGRPIAAVLLTEALFVPLTVLWALGVARILARRVPARQIALTGTLGGLATLTRTTLLLAWTGLVALLLWTFRREHHSRRALWLLVVPLLVCLGLAGARNWVVSGRFVVLPTSGPINFHLGNPPPTAMVASSPGRRVMYERLGLDPRTQSVIEYAINAPRAFLRNLTRKAAFALGCFGALGAPAGCSPAYLAIWAAALAGLIALVWPGLPGGAHGPPRAVPALLGLSHLAVVVLFAPVIYMVPNIYGDRLVFPLAVLLLPYAAAVLGPTAEAAAAFVIRSAPVQEHDDGRRPERHV